MCKHRGQMMFMLSCSCPQEVPNSDWASCVTSKSECQLKCTCSFPVYCQTWSTVHKQRKPGPGFSRHLDGCLLGRNPSSSLTLSSKSYKARERSWELGFLLVNRSISSRASAIFLTRFQTYMHIHHGGRCVRASSLLDEKVLTRRI